MFPPFRAGTNLNPSNRCLKDGIEKEIIKKMNFTVLDGHNEALYYWLDQGILDKEQSFTLLHFDSRSIS